MKKTRLLTEENWEVLIILDACRWDYFSKCVPEYLAGNLEKRVSSGTSTLEWCINSFLDYYPDIVYISGNPYINSNYEIKGFDAKEHFGSIYNVWASGWDETWGTVLPETITSVAQKVMPVHKDKRFIIHYIQPHAPYLSETYHVVGFADPSARHGLLSGIADEGGNKRSAKIADLIGKGLVKVGLLKNSWTIRELINLPPASPMDAVRRLHGDAGLRMAYRENLRMVLQNVRVLCGEILGRNPTCNIVISADHGEFLGENGRYSHPHGSNDPILREVPWFHVKEIVGKSKSEERERQKIKSLVHRLSL